MDPQRWGEIERLYHLARERESGEREKFLAEACGGDEHLRQEVESLLARPPKAQDFLEAPALEVAAMALAKDQPPVTHADPVGRTLLHYRLVAKIGEGGMGVVYRAHDAKLGRDVAIKILPDEFAGDRQRLARFAREAKLLASLNHPNVAAIHGFEETDDKPFLVLELVEGITLAEKLRKGRLSLEESLGVCRQIAEGLEAAHEMGIIHRDLKPANVQLTPGGKVKILDFGLAKALYGQSPAPESSEVSKDESQGTASGIVLGTAAYMSPEQATGKPADKRTDIWAFGCVLYECLTGGQTFHGRTVTETLAAILKEEPDWQALPAATPWRVKDLLHRCLKKDPRERLRDIGDARIEMQEQMALAKEPLRVSQRLLRVWVIAACATMLVIGALIGPAVMKYFKPEASQILQHVVRSPVRLEPGYWLDGMRWLPPYGFDQPTRTAMAISSDGRFIVYSAIAENPGPRVKSQLFLRRTDQLEAKPIPGTEEGISPFLSPDDRWVGFCAGDKLMKVSIDGGVPVSLCDVAMSPGATWGSDNSIVFAPSLDSGLSRVSAEGGKPEILTTPDKNEATGHRLPYYLPDSKGVLFTIMREWYDSHPRVALLDLKTRKWSVLIEDAADARYVSTGHLVFLRQGTLMAVPFDPEKLQLTGQSVPTISKVMQAINIPNTAWGTAAGQFSVSNTGWLVYVSGGVAPPWQNSLVWVDRKANAQPVASFKAPFYAPRLSPDGQWIAYAAMRGEWQAWVYNLNRGTASMLTGEGQVAHVMWTPDGKRVVFNWWSSGQLNLYWQPADGSQPMERLTTSDYRQDPGSFSPDGTTLAFVECCRPDIDTDILLLDLRSRRVAPFLNTKSQETYPEISPDGRWITYVSDESGRMEVYIRPFPGPGGKWLISHQGGTEPLWARDGKQLFYRSLDYQQVWVVDVQTDGSLFASKPRPLFKALGFALGWPIRGWDISHDGQRFLMVKSEERRSQPVTEMILVQNWFEELKRLAPTGKK
jgi:hypothetical protein